MSLKGFSFAGEGIAEAVDLMVDDHGYLWLVDQRSTYCLLDDRPVPVHELTSPDTVLGFDGIHNGRLTVRTSGEPLELPLGARRHGPFEEVRSMPPATREVDLPDGRRFLLGDSGMFSLINVKDTIRGSLHDDHHGRSFEVQVGPRSRLLMDPRNGIWVLGSNGLVLASHLASTFELVEVPGLPGKVTKVREFPEQDLIVALSHTRGLFFQRRSTGASLFVVREDEAGNRVGGVKWWTVRDRHFIHGRQQVQEVHPTEGRVSVVTDLTRLSVPGASSMRINNFDAHPACRYLYVGTQDNVLVLVDPVTGTAVPRTLKEPGTYSGINLVYEIGLFGGDRAIVLTEHDFFLVDGATGPIRPASQEWRSFRFGPRFRASSVRVIGDTLVAVSSFANGMYLYHVGRDSLYRPVGREVDRMEVADLFWDGGDHLLGTTRKGLLVYRIDDNTCRLVRPEHGLPMEDLLYRYMTLMEPGRMALGLTDRYTTFRVEDLLSGPEALYVEALSVNGVTRSVPPYRPVGERMRLLPTETSVGFRLGSPMQSGPPYTASFIRTPGDPGGRLYEDEEEIRVHGLSPGDHTIAFAYRKEDPYDPLVQLSVAQFFWKQWWFISGIALLLVLTTAMLVAWRSRVLRDKVLLQAEYDARITELELSSLRARMHPHFIFNSLNSIKSFIAANEPRTATRYLNKFAQLVRSILNDSGKAEVDLRSELKGLELYLELERMRFDGSFDLELQVDPAIDPERVLVPPLIVQPYAENAIWHGLMHKTGDRKLTIGVARENGDLRITVRDNGIGREASRALNATSARKHRSLGMSITEEVIERSGNGAGVDVLDLSDPDGGPAGTEVRIRIPYRTQ